MDEKGCMKGIGDNLKVFVPQSKAEAFSAQPRESRIGLDYRVC
jgi:hypothetical protein